MILLRLIIRIPPILWLAIAGYLGWSDYQEFKTTVRDPKIAEIESKKSQAAAKKAEIARAEDFKTRREEKLTELQRLGQTLEDTKSKLPPTSSVPELLKSMADIADVTGLSFSKFRPGAERRKQFLVETPIEVTLTGSYVQIMSFLDSLANLTRIVTTDKLAFENPQFRSGVSVLTANATLITYHLDDTEGGGGAKSNGP